VPSAPQQVMLLQKTESLLRISWVKPLATNGPLTGYHVTATGKFSYSHVSKSLIRIPLLLGVKFKTIKNTYAIPRALQSFCPSPGGSSSWNKNDIWRVWLQELSMKFQWRRSIPTEKVSLPLPQCGQKLEVCTENRNTFCITGCVWELSANM
jgi:hypothetical protein